MGQVNQFALTGSLLRAARALIEISAAELASESGVGERTILRAEQTNGPVVMRPSNLASILSALEGRGVVFLAADMTGGPGIRLARDR